MSEWEEFCENMGVNAGDPDDYDRLENYLLNDGPHPRRLSVSDVELDEHLPQLRFATFKEASEWALKNQGRPFTRSSDGTSFVPASPERQEQARSVSSDSDGLSADAWDDEALYHSNPSEFYEKCYENERRTFYPKLRSLAPFWGRRADRGRYTCFMERTFLTRISGKALADLLDLLQRKAVRTERWYGVQRDDHLEHIAKREQSGYAGQPSWLKDKDARYKQAPRRPPEDLKFWRDCAGHVQTEISRRAEGEASTEIVRSEG